MKRLISSLLVIVLMAAGTSAVAQEYVPTPVTVSKEKVKLNGKVYLSHVVLERQTLYGIAKAYGVSEQDLYEANPTLRETGLQKNAILLIPYRENMADPSAQDRPEGTLEHTVRWYEDIEDIANRYDVTVKDIMEANGLKSRKLTARQTLIIPNKAAPAASEETESLIPREKPADSLVAQAESKSIEVQEAAPEAEPILQLTPKESVSLSLVLPLRAAGEPSELNMDFYSGALLAVKDLEAQGIKVQMHVYDLMAGMPPIDALQRSDFVLGPVASRDLEAVLQRLEGKVPVISPLDQKAGGLSAQYPSFIQVPTPADSQYEDLAAWVKEDLQPGEKVLLITEKGASNVTAAVAIRSAMAQRELEYEILNYAIVEGRGIPALLTEQMTQDAVNRVVVASESEAFMGDVVRNLGIMLGKGYNLVLYAPSKVRTFDTIDGSAYHDALLHISTSYYADYSKPEVDRFVRAYRALFQTEPSQFAFQGYDTVHFFTSRVARYGEDWMKLLGRERGLGLHTDFQFGKDAYGNMQNKAVRRIVFQKNYTTTLLDR